MVLFIKQDDKFKLTSNEALDLHDKLPVGTYTVGVSQCDGSFFLQIINDFTCKGKLYGKTTRSAKRIMDTFLDRESSTGVLMTGEKGSGKTLLAKVIAMEAASKYKIPTIVINRSLHGEDFNKFLQSITQPTVIVFDEFEKVYHRSEEQEAMLTLLDGVYPSKKLFLLTCNEKDRINSHLKNRPGRIYYFLDFNGLNQEFITEYCQDKLILKEHIPKVCAVSAMFDAFNFDMLKAMVEEMNRYGESPTEVLEFLNIRPEFSESQYYNMKMTVGGKQLTYAKHHMRDSWHGNPMTEEIEISYQWPRPAANPCEDGSTSSSGDDDTNDYDYEYTSIKFSSQHIQRMDGNKGEYVFYYADKKAQLVLTKQVPPPLNIDKLVGGSKDCPKQKNWRGMGAAITAAIDEAKTLASFVEVEDSSDEDKVAMMEVNELE